MTVFRAAWPRLAALVAAGIVAVIGAELVARALNLAPDGGVFTVTEREFRSVPGIFAPGQATVMGFGDFEHVVRINALGYRGPELAVQRGDEVLRVFVAGDSFTFGHNVDDDETLPAQLESLLAAERCGPVEVVNGGLSGSTILAQRHLVERALDLSPDVVLLVYHENDIPELADVRMWDQLAGNRRTKSRFPLGLVYPILRESSLWKTMLHVTWQWRAGGSGDEEVVDEASPETSPTPIDRPATPPNYEAARREYADLLSQTARLLEEADVPLVFVAYPHPTSVRDGIGGSDYRWALDTARSHGIETIDLIDFLPEAVAVEDAYLLPHDYHPSPVGHRLAAGRLSSALTRRGFGSCSGATLAGDLTTSGARTPEGTP